MKQAMLITALLGLLSVPAGTWAQGRPNLVVEIQVERVVEKPDGKGGITTILEPATETQRDDVLVYTLRWKNDGDGPARGAVLSDPVPEGTTLLRGSLEGAADVTYSTDGEQFSAWPQIRIADAQGNETWKDAPASAVRHIRLRLAEAVPPGGQGEASFKVLVQ
jgi:uncharacterized repeat protein (TIGR01451 family)